MGENLKITSNDYLSLYLKIITALLSKYDLSLSKVKWKGTFLVGANEDIRKFFVQLLLKIITESEINILKSKIFLNPILKIYLDNLIPEKLKNELFLLTKKLTKSLNLELDFYGFKAIEATLIYLYIENKNINIQCFIDGFSFKTKELYTHYYNEIYNTNILKNHQILEDNLPYIIFTILTLYGEFYPKKNSLYGQIVSELELYFDTEFSPVDKHLFISILECSNFKKNFELYNFSNYTTSGNDFNIPINIVSFFKSFLLKYNLNFLEDDYFKISLFFYHQILQKKIRLLKKHILAIDFSLNNWIGKNLKLSFERILKKSTIEIFNESSENIPVHTINNADYILFTSQIDFIYFKNRFPEQSNKFTLIEYHNFFQIENIIFYLIFNNKILSYEKNYLDNSL
ncbi:MAG: hypothetical protein RR191_01385 [Cetobacterium sp.]|uniref:hypothetical protein n=1 Tax=Cetobacterium sp. TaxID=2071632 RepID=UPI002FCA017F